jgi:hypothetical protein
MNVLFQQMTLIYKQKFLHCIHKQSPHTTSMYYDIFEYICYSTNWNPVGSRILLVQIGIPISTSGNWNSDLYWI